MAGDAYRVEIVHAGALEAGVGENEPARLDDVDPDAETGGEAQDGAGVLGDVRFEKGEAHINTRS